MQYDAVVRAASLLLVTACWSSSPQPPPPEPIANSTPSGGPAELEPLPAHTVWRGFYECAQGRTAVQLTIDIEPTGATTAIFDFGPHADNPGVPPGSFRLSGTSREQGKTIAFQLEPDRWISQPPAYEMVGVAAVVGSRRQRMKGQITNPACATIDVQRVP